MKHLQKGRKFGRERKGRVALMKTLCYALFLRGRIQTTEAKAKEVRPVAEKIITHAKSGGLAKMRLVGGSISPKIVKKVFEEIAPRYKDRTGGYTRIIKLGMRKSDGAKMAIIELVK